MELVEDDGEKDHELASNIFHGPMVLGPVAGDEGGAFED
jgi:hypothetical protein